MKIAVGIKGNTGNNQLNELTSRKSNKTVTNEMEYNWVNFQTDIAEVLNQFFIENGPNLSKDPTEVDKSFEEFLTEIDKNLVFVTDEEQHQHMFQHYYQSLSQRQPAGQIIFQETSEGML